VSERVDEPVKQHSPRPRPVRRPVGLATRLLAALILVVLAGALTAWLVAAAVAPGLFHAHMLQAGAGISPQAQHHAEVAFQSTNAISMATALLASLVASVAVSIYLARRLGRSVRPLSRAATEVSAGRYRVRVPPLGLGTEFDDLGVAFNQMAGRLERVEHTRRRLLSDLAHELRTPVATLDAYLDGLEDGVAQLDGETLEVLRTQTRRLTRLAEDVSAVSRAEENQLSLHPAHLAPGDLVVAASTAATSRYAAKGVDLVTEVEPGLPNVAADPDRMGQVLSNLLDNALRHTPTGGKVAIRAAITGGLIHLSVSDSGHGIPAEHLFHIFERFYRVDTARDRAHGGSGIGLAIVKALVQAHGGNVTATSSGTGQGATFTITLPPAP
jgi:two-component system sensor histidine kinase BaeS